MAVCCEGNIFFTKDNFFFFTEQQEAADNGILCCNYINGYHIFVRDKLYSLFYTFRCWLQRHCPHIALSQICTYGSDMAECCNILHICTCKISSSYLCKMGHQTFLSAKLVTRDFVLAWQLLKLSEGISCVVHWCCSISGCLLVLFERLYFVNVHQQSVSATFEWISLSFLLSYVFLTCKCETIIEQHFIENWFEKDLLTCTEFTI